MIYLGRNHDDRELFTGLFEKVSPLYKTGWGKCSQSIQAMIPMRLGEMILIFSISYKNVIIIEAYVLL